jgi:hypothetical protein
MLEELKQRKAAQPPANAQGPASGHGPGPGGAKAGDKPK